MTRILSIDPSGTGTTGMFFKSNSEEQFISCQNPDWKKHYDFILEQLKVYHPDILLYEHSNYVSSRGKDMTSLLKLLGTMETLTLPCSSTRLRIEAVPVNQVKESRGKLLKGEKTIAEISYQPGKGWHHHQKKISTHELDAYLIYWLWKSKAKDKQKSRLIGKSIGDNKTKQELKEKVIKEELPWDDDDLPNQKCGNSLCFECEQFNCICELRELQKEEETEKPDIKGSALICEGCGHSRGLCICEPEEIEDHD